MPTVVISMAIGFHPAVGKSHPFHLILSLNRNISLTLASSSPLSLLCTPCTSRGQPCLTSLVSTRLSGVTLLGVKLLV